MLIQGSARFGAFRLGLAAVLLGSTVDEALPGGIKRSLVAFSTLTRRPQVHDISHDVSSCECKVQVPTPTTSALIAPRRWQQIALHHYQDAVGGRARETHG